MSTVATIIQMVVMLAATNTEVLRAVVVPLAFAGAAADFYGIAFAFLVWRQNSGGMDERARAFSAWTAIGFAAVLTVILLVSKASEEWFGASGVIVTTTLAGLVNVDPAAISVPTETALPILLALSANTITKAILCIYAGGYPGLAVVLLAAWTGWWLT